MDHLNLSGCEISIVAIRQAEEAVEETRGPTPAGIRAAQQQEIQKILDDKKKRESAPRSPSKGYKDDCITRIGD